MPNGPVIRLVMSCTHCVHRVKLQSGSGCENTPTRAVRMFGYREQRRTPSWCPLRGSAVSAFLDRAERNKRIWDTVEDDDEH